MYLSPSKLIGYKLCPYKQKHSKFKASDATRFGTSVDAGIEAWLRGGDFNDTFCKTAIKEGLELTDDYLKRAKTCIETLQNADWLNIQTENIMAIQANEIMQVVPPENIAEFYGKKFFQVNLGLYGLRGATDLIDVYVNEQEQSIIRVIDWKTGFSEADDLQLACYALMVWKLYDIPFDFIETRFFYLEQGGMSPSRKWSKETLVGAYRAVEAVAKQYIADKEFKPKINKYCSYCEFKGNCTEYRQAITLQPESTVPTYSIEQMPELVQALDRIQAIKKITSSVEAELKSQRDKLLADVGGTTIIDGVEYSIKERPSSYNYDLPAIFSGVQDIIDRPPFEIMKFDSGAFNNLVRETSDKVAKKALKAVKQDAQEVAKTTIKFSARIASTTELADE